jgi:hypothetical protein
MAISKMNIQTADFVDVDNKEKPSFAQKGTCKPKILTEESIVPHLL